MIELVLYAKGGDHEAFTTLLRAYEGGVRSVCRRFGKDPDDAEDLVLETFVEAYLKFGQLRSPEAFEPWLKRIALNLCRSRYREQKSDPVLLSVDPPAPEAEVVQDDRLLWGMDKLSTAHRRVLDLHYQAGMSYREMAEELSVPIGTVMSRTHRARNALKAIVETSEELNMDEQSELERRFRMEIELLEALKAEVDAVEGITKVKGHSAPMMRLRQVLETHPPRLVDLLRVSDSDERLIHLAWLARFAMKSAVPVMASCALSDDEVLRNRAIRLAEYWVVRIWYGLRGIDLFLDTLIASPSDAKLKVRVLVRLIQTVKECGPGHESDSHHVILELTKVLLGYPEEAFPVLWEALWELDENDTVEYGVRKAIAHLVEPMSDALVEEVNAGNRDRVARVVRELSFVPFRRSQSMYGKVTGLPARLHPVLVELAASDDSEISKDATVLAVRFRIPGIVSVLRSQIVSGNLRDRADAITAIAHVIGEAAVQELITHVYDPESRVRAAALTALGQLKGTSVKDKILERVEKDEDTSVREAAIKAYGKIATDPEREACLKRITKAGDRKMIRIAAKALYTGTGPRQKSKLEEDRLGRIRGDSLPRKHVDPVGALRALPELRKFEEEELTKVVAGLCGDYSTTRRQMVMEGRHALMRREKGVYSFTQIGEAVWRVGQFVMASRDRLPDNQVT
jgi:RNA polymerase sigma-70 factor (ECF subfamily)